MKSNKGVAFVQFNLKSQADNGEKPSFSFMLKLLDLLLLLTVSYNSQH